MKKELILEVKITEMETFTNFLELIEQYYDDLPKELQNRIVEIEHTGINDINADNARLLYGDYKIYESSFGNKQIMAINKMLKRVIYMEDGKQIEEYPTYFWHSFDGNKIVEW